ncbi:DUF2254 domain-containing protein [Propionimicrobium lymphophilum]|uniref:DUF2254 domain-containing protein n=1 Tax=Propionimicrobium lymphophilum TaxID=33012 RepID=UPI0009DBEE21|nr:DUF2254 domain-containing protein [Propionimicrobium lymphophilum]
MRVIFNRVRQFFSSRLWTWPLFMGILALCLGSFLGSLHLPEDGVLAEYLWPGSASSAADMISMIFSTALTVLTTTISMTLIVLQVASGNFSHQLLRDFIQSRAVRGIISVYVFIICFSVAALRSIHTSDIDRPPQFAVAAAILLIFIAVATFIWYVTRVVEMVRVDSVIRTSIDKSAQVAHKVEKEHRENLERPYVPERARTVTSNGFGYIQSIDVDHASQWARDNDATIVIDCRPGDMVIIGMAWARYWFEEDREDTPDLPEVIYLDDGRISGSDYTLGLRQVLDIGVRALSPGVNDPTTAVHAFGQCSTILRDLAEDPIFPEVRRDDDDRLLVWAAARRFDEILEDFCGEIRRYGSHEPLVLISLLQVLESVYEIGDKQIKEMVLAQQERIIAAAKKKIEDPVDLQHVLDAAWEEDLLKDPPPDCGV